MYRIKQVFTDLFRVNEFFSSNHVNMRLYKNGVDNISMLFTPDDWKMIFSDNDRNTIDRWSMLDDRVVLSCFNKDTNLLFGFIMIFQPRERDNDVWFHGGGWLHNRKTSLLIYEGLYKILEFLIEKNFIVHVSCLKENVHADLLQKQFGFVVFATDEKALYKHLDRERFKNCDIPNRLEKCFNIIVH